jgi:RNA-directed DNA polymerase
MTVKELPTAGVLVDGLVGPTDEETPQGGPLSPLLSNPGFRRGRLMMLDVLDKELEGRGHRFVRGACPRAAQRADPWADDGNIYVQSRRAGALRQAQEGHGRRRTLLDRASQAAGHLKLPGISS